MNHSIAYNLQDIINLLPNLNVEELVKAMLIKTNDMHLVMYISSLIRSVTALHDLLNNKLKYKDMDEIMDREVGLVDGGENSKKEKEKEKEVAADKTSASANSGNSTPSTPAKE